MPRVGVDRGAPSGGQRTRGRRHRGDGHLFRNVERREARLGGARAAARDGGAAEADDEVLGGRVAPPLARTAMAAWAVMVREQHEHAPQQQRHAAAD
eukprot:1233628-Prymnesium_polylepis.2